MDRTKPRGLQAVSIKRRREIASLGGHARVKNTTPERRSEIAKKAVETRWKNYEEKILQANLASDSSS